MKRITGLGFLIFIGVIAVVYFIFSSKVYPVATVNGGLISAHAFQITSVAAEQYYTNLLGTYGGSASTTQEEFTSAMRRIALQALIEDSLVKAYLETIYEPAPLELAVNKRVDEVLAASDGQTAAAAQELFGVTAEEFKEVVLLPQARIELLKKELEIKQIDPGVWMDEQLHAAIVTITLRDLTWGDAQVELTGVQSYTAEVQEFLEDFSSSTEELQDDASSTSEDDFWD